MNRLLTIFIIPFVLPCLALAGPQPKRIVSLAPSTTEILFALGLGDRIVGVTSFCDYPAEAKAKPKIGGMSNPSLEEIIAVKPDIVVLTTDGNPQGIDGRLRSLDIPIHIFTSRRISELPDGIRRIGQAVGVRERADTLAREIEKGLEGRKAAGGSRKGENLSTVRLTPPASRKVLFIVWPEPLIVAGPGTAIDDAIALLGYENIASGTKTAYPKYSIEEVIRQAPDILFIGKGSGMDMSIVSRGILARLGSVPAVRNGKVCYVSDNLYRLGPRVIKGIQELEGYLAESRGQGHGSRGQ